MGLKMDDSPPAGSSPAQSDVELPDAPTSAGAASEGDKDTKVALDGLFDQDSDDEFPTSSAMPSSPPTQTLSITETETAPPVQTEAYSDPNVMRQFYARLFPFRPLFLWLNHSPKPGPDFGNREFAFTVLTPAGDTYLRYMSYTTHDLLKKDILRLNPSRFEIGPVYTSNPRDRKTLRKASTFKPLSKEVVFDIDMDAYDDVRSCCTGANICEKCWSFTTMAIKVVDVALREDFGFEHIMWVYSGRRGVHAWVSDKEARELDDEKRKAITGYFEVLKGGAQGGKKVNLRRPLHPHIVRSLEILKPYFQQVLADQEPFKSGTGQEKLLSLLPDKTLNEALRKKWESSPDRPSTRKWADIDALAATGVSKSLDTKALMEAKQDILLEYTYPRLDVEVGKKRNHLLKSPFVVHPKTGKVCVPITASGDMKQAESFDPLTVPKVTDLLSEVDRFSKNEADSGSTPDGSATQLMDWEKTSLKPYVDTFDLFVKSLVKSETVRVKRERDEDGHSGADGMEF
jgi:DNA primase small subunit